MLLINPEVLNQLNYTHVVRFYDGKLIKSLPLSEVPMIEAKPIRYGRWEFVNDYQSRCTACKKESWVDHNEEPDYCPKCGADMRGK